MVRRETIILPLYRKKFGERGAGSEVVLVSKPCLKITRLVPKQSSYSFERKSNKTKLNVCLISVNLEMARRLRLARKTAIADFLFRLRHTTTTINI
ncbi:hypothetical protein AVEN_137354-1 [Araneus ventricosus]|uniref:Uncharacterized protein n=1 Tax=Araneus ventricosus TaxID=182803 RepID=A0A4Y2G6E0_ARAVE|nr:hypothetical protein AVEN_137354-1 [Araneus ventricosus]